MRAKVYLALIVFVVLVTSAEAQGPPGQMPPPAVTLAPVELKSVSIEYEYVGTTEASKVVEVRARVQGFLETRSFEEGDFIQEGTKLFTIDPRSLKADKEIAVAHVEQAKARLELAQREVQRLRSVKVPGAVAETDLDVKLAEGTNAAAALRLAEAQLAKAELELSYTTVEAPLTGYIGKALKDIGSLVDPGQNSLLAVMQQVDPLYVGFHVSESDYLAWRRSVESGELVLSQGLSNPYLEIIFLDATVYDEKGTIDFAEVAVDISTGTVGLRGTFANPDRKLKPGQFVKVHIKGWERPNSLSVPQRAVSQSPQGPFVYVVGPDNIVERRSIKVGPWAGDDWIILEGLQAGENVIVEGLTKVMPGIPVNPEPAQAAESTQPTQAAQE